MVYINLFDILSHTGLYHFHLFVIYTLYVSYHMHTPLIFYQLVFTPQQCTPYIALLYFYTYAFIYHILSSLFPCYKSSSGFSYIHLWHITIPDVIFMLEISLGGVYRILSIPNAQASTSMVTTGLNIAHHHC